jgi:hypothetical protein
MQQKKLVTIITESAVESRLVEDLERLGARGYTVLEARGKGARGARTADWDQNLTVQIEVICDKKVARAILEHCQNSYASNYALVMYMADVQVLRAEKF